MNHRSI